MARPRLWVSAVAAAATLTIAGCYGSTEPATSVTFDGAKLNARGTANHGQAKSWFEFWATDGGTHYELGDQTWPAGASGPFSYTETNLVPNTNYSFRLCGNDVGGDPVCAQTRTFTTADGDTASGTFTSGDSGASFAAQSGPHGERAAGSQVSCISGTCHRFDLDCLKVSGNRAILGMGQSLYMVQDTTPDTIAFPPRDTSPQCDTATAADFVVNPSYTVDVTVHDAP
jgi:hypothetical protein